MFSYQFIYKCSPNSPYAKYLGKELLMYYEDGVMVAYDHGFVVDSAHVIPHNTLGCDNNDYNRGIIKKVYRCKLIVALCGAGPAMDELVMPEGGAFVREYGKSINEVSVVGSYRHLHFTVDYSTTGTRFVLTNSLNNNKYEGEFSKLISMITSCHKRYS